MLRNAFLAAVLVAAACTSPSRDATAVAGLVPPPRGGVDIEQRRFDTDPEAERMYLGPRRAMPDEYVATLDRLGLDGFVYPAIQMPPPDETMPQDG